MPEQIARTHQQSYCGLLDSEIAPPIEDADLHASSAEYAERFAGAVGQWMLKVQEDALLSMLSGDSESILDVGGGHGQTAIPLCRAGKAVTVLGSSPECAARLSTEIKSGSVSFKSGNLIELPYSEQSFSAVVSFRLISHCAAWKKLVAEMCRVAERDVIFDYPSWASTNVLTPALFFIKRRIEGNTRTYRIFSKSELVQEFRKHGFLCTALRKQFFFPMGLHRFLKSPRLSRILEDFARRLGLTSLWGSPVVIKFERCNHDGK